MRTNTFKDMNAQLKDPAPAGVNVDEVAVAAREFPESPRRVRGTSPGLRT